MRFTGTTTLVMAAAMTLISSAISCTTVYVGNLSYAVTSEDLNGIFAEYGTVVKVLLPTDNETGRLRGFAFVTLSTDAEGDAAIAALDEAEWMGRNLRVNCAKN
ncbi:hypothetical protein EC991_010855 [Linnemannia zychae]|nr:hypothetical protein EC991_010855 [Linnemannia zychae]